MSVNKKVEKMIERAVGVARDNNHEYVTLEHILLSLLHEKEISELILSIGCQPAKIRTDLVGHLGDKSMQKPEELRDTPPKRTAAVNRTLQRAMTR